MKLRITLEVDILDVDLVGLHPTKEQLIDYVGWKLGVPGPHDLDNSLGDVMARIAVKAMESLEVIKK